MANLCKGKVETAKTAQRDKERAIEMKHLRRISEKMKWDRIQRMREIVKQAGKKEQEKGETRGKHEQNKSSRWGNVEGRPTKPTRIQR